MPNTYKLTLNFSDPEFYQLGLGTIVDDGGGNLCLEGEPGIITVPLPIRSVVKSIKLRQKKMGALNSRVDVYYYRDDISFPVAIQRGIAFTNTTATGWFEGEGVTTYQEPVDYLVLSVFAPNVWIKSNPYDPYDFDGTKKSRLDDVEITYEAAVLNECSCLADVYTCDPVTSTPINLRTGEKQEYVTDLSINTPGEPLTFTRVYHQNKVNIHQDNPFSQQRMGRAWSHNHNIYLNYYETNGVIQSNFITASLENGGEALFIRNPNDSNRFDAVTGESSYIQIVNQYVRELRTPEQTLIFNGRVIVKRQWKTGYEWNYTYANNKLDRVLDGFGRYLKFVYDSNHGQLYRVGDHTAQGLETTTPTGRYVEFSYISNKEAIDVTGSPTGISCTVVYGMHPLLSTVRDVHGSVWTYEYERNNCHSLNWLKAIKAPTADLDDNGTQETLLLKSMDYTFNNHRLTSITEKLGSLDGVNFDLTKQYNLPTSSNATTREIVAGITTEYLFDDELYVGSRDPLGNMTSQELDENQRPIVQRDALGNETHLTWSEDGHNLLSITNPNGAQTLFEYDQYDRLTLMAHPGGQILQEYPSNDHRKPSKKFHYAANADVEQADFLLEERFEYDGYERLTQKEIYRGSIPIKLVRYGYYPAPIDENDIDAKRGYGLLKQVDMYDLKANPNPTIGMPGDKQILYFYDDAGRRTYTKKTSLFGSCSHTYTVYDKVGQVVATVCTNNSIPDYSHLNITEGLPTTQEEAYYLYDSIDPNSRHITTYDYDVLGRLVSVTTHDGYDDSILVIPQDPNWDGCIPNATESFYQQTTRYFYDGLNRVVRQIPNYIPSLSPSNAIDWVWRDVNGNGRYAWRLSDTDDAVVDHGENQTDNLIEDIAYNARGQVRMRRNVLGHVTLYGYDIVGRLIKTIENAANEDYDNDYSADPSLGNYAVNAQLSDADIVSTFGYDVVGNLVEVVDARQQRSSFIAYDAISRPVRIVRNAKPTATVDIDPLDANGDPNPAYYAVNDPRSSNYIAEPAPDLDQIEEIQYDAASRLVRTAALVDNRFGYSTWDVTFYLYDDLNRQAKVVAHASQPQYNILSDPDLASYPFSTDPDKDLIIEIDYDPQGRVRYVEDVMGSRHWRAYDGFNRLTHQVLNASLNPVSATAETPIDDTYLGQIDDPAQDIISRFEYNADGQLQKSQETLQTENGSLAFLSSLFGYDIHYPPAYTTTIINASDDTYPINLYPAASGYLPDNNYTVSGNSDEDRIIRSYYNELGLVTKTLDDLENVSFYGYDRSGRHVKTIINASNLSYNTCLNTSYDIDLSGYTPDNPAVDQDQIISITYDVADRTVAVERSTADKPIRQTRYVYDKLGRPTRRIDNYIEQTTSPEAWVWNEAAAAWQLSENNSTLVDQGNNDRNLVTDIAYNKAGQIQQIRDVRGMFTTYTYDLAGRMRTQTDAAVSSLAITQFTCFDKIGRVLRTIDSYQPIQDGSGNFISPDAVVNGLWTFDPQTNGADKDENLITVFTYDQAHRVVAVQNPKGEIAQLSYFADGKLAQSTDPAEVVTAYRYDALRRLTTVVENYTASSNPDDWDYYDVSSVFAWRNTNDDTVINHGAANDENIIVQLTYDKRGRVLTMRNPNGEVADFEYDKLSRRIKRMLPAINDNTGTPDAYRPTWTTAYFDNVAGQASYIEMTQPGLNTDASAPYTVRYDFDRLGRPVAIDYGQPDTTPNVAFAYDLAGNRQSMQELGLNEAILRTTSYRYDALNRVVSVDLDPDASTLGDIKNYDPVGYAYDAGGLRTQMTFSGGLNVNYEYDIRGRLVQLTDWDDQASSFTYDKVSRQTQAVRPNGLVTDYAYDPVGNLLEVLHQEDATTKAQFMYQVDERGYRTQASERLMKPDASVDEQTIVYDYDALSRLTSTEYHAGFNTPTGTLNQSFSYGYDPAGNMVLRNGVTRSYNAANQLIDDGTYSLAYDRNGNLLNDGVNDYGWDRANRLVSAPGNTSYVYDGAGNRIQQVVNGTKTDYLNDSVGLTQVIESTNDTTVERFLHGPMGIHAQSKTGRGTPTLWGQAAWNSEPTWSQSTWGQDTWGRSLWGGDTVGSTTWQYLLQDGLGSVRSVADDAAAIGETRSYAPYGTLLSQVGTSQSVYGFAGEQMDTNGLSYNRSRYYNPAIATFTSLDPVEGLASLPMSLNGYSYVHGNPTNLIDPTGTFANIIIGGVAGAAIGAFVGRLLAVTEAELTYALAAKGECGCERKKEVLEIGYTNYMRDARDVGTFMGAMVGMMAGIGGPYAVAIGTVMEWIGFVGTARVIEDLWNDVITEGDFELDDKCLLVEAVFELTDFLMGKMIENFGNWTSRRSSSGTDLPRRPGDFDLPGRRPSDIDAPGRPRDGGGCSFSADTIVATPDGEKPISDVQVGDVLLAYNEASDEIGAFSVLATYTQQHDSTLDLTIDGEIIHTTDEHPFYVADRGWVDAAYLNPGDVVLAADGSTGTVEAVEIVNELQMMYNLTIELVATYLVGDGQWVVHNQNSFFPGLLDLGWKNRHTDIPSSTMIDYIPVRAGIYEYRSRGNSEGSIYVGMAYTSLRSRLNNSDKRASFGNNFKNVAYSYIDLRYEHIGEFAERVRIEQLWTQHGFDGLVFTEPKRFSNLATRQQTIDFMQTGQWRKYTGWPEWLQLPRELIDLPSYCS